MDNCNYNLSSSFTRYGSNDTTNCQLNKDNFNGNKDTLTQKQIYSNIANRTVRNFSVCVDDEIINEPDDESGSGVPSIPSTPTPSPTPPPNLTPPPISEFNINRATESVSVFHPDQIPEIEVESNYPSCSYKPIKF